LDLPVTMNVASPSIDAWQVMSSRVSLTVPLGETWHELPRIRDQDGHILFKVLREDSIGQLIAGEPILRLMMGDANGELVAVVERHTCHGHDGYRIYGPMTALFREEECPHSRWSRLGAPLHRWRHHAPPTGAAPYRFEHPAPPPSRAHDGGDTWPTEEEDASSTSSHTFYPLVTVTQGILGKTYMVESVDGHRIRWRAENPRFRRTLLLCPCCITLGCCVWEFEFEDLNGKSTRHGKSWRPWMRTSRQEVLVPPGSGAASDVTTSSRPPPLILVRDQAVRKLEIGPGISPLLAVCVTYAMDRLTRPIV
jgi:hypothetical protein